jgi:glycine/sarcosine N-methyltransferase
LIDAYVDFADRYDLPYGSAAQPDWDMVEFFRTVFAQNGVKRVLDCACGTGRHLQMLRDLGCEVYGSDVSPSMLEQAQINLAADNVKVQLRQADYRCLPENFNEHFDAEICLGAIGYMQDEVQFLKAFESMGGVLREDGILVLTVIPSDRQWKEKPKFALAADKQECSRIFAMDYFAHKVRYNVLDLLRGSGGTELKIWSADLTVMLRDDQERLLKTSGFQRVEFFGGYDFSPYEKAASNQMITIAYK